MEAFEQFVAIAMESEGLVVSPAVKFDVARKTAKLKYNEIQKHGYEVDLVGARADQLVLATVKSFLGSRGVVADHVAGTTTSERGRRLYLLLNEPQVRAGVVGEACRRFGYSEEQVRLRLYVGRFAGRATGEHEERIKQWCSMQIVGGGPIEVINLDDVVQRVRKAASSRQYRDNPVLVTMKVLHEAGLLEVPLPDVTDDPEGLTV